MHADCIPDQQQHQELEHSSKYPPLTFVNCTTVEGILLLKLLMWCQCEDRWLQDKDPLGILHLQMEIEQERVCTV